MKIGPLDTPQAVAPAASERKPGASTPGRPAAEASARVELSEAAALNGSASGEVQFDQAKVDRIAQAIRDGRFTIDADAIADKLIANAQELLGRAGR